MNTTTTLVEPISSYGWSSSPSSFRYRSRSKNSALVGRFISQNTAQREHCEETDADAQRPPIGKHRCVGCSGCFRNRSVNESLLSKADFSQTGAFE